MKKIVTVVGARPQFIKLATVSRAIAALRDLREVLVHTGQHYDANMSDVFFQQMDIPIPDHHLGVGGGSHGAMTGRQLERIEQVLVDERPDCVLVYGDTNSTLAGALAAVKLHIPVAHVEAGLRSFNRRMPEEINRVLTDQVSAMLFAPTAVARENLLREGVDGSSIHVVGDVMCDAAHYYRARAREPGWFTSLGIDAGAFVLCTIHRAENTDDTSKLMGIVEGLGGAEAPVVLPLHPRTRKKLGEAGLDLPRHVHVVDPVGYLEMIWLEMNCRVVATDSGGVQKEAYFHGKPCVTLRDETEWVELVRMGCNRTVGSDPRKIREAVAAARFESIPEGIYGIGDAASRIATILADRLTGSA